MGQIHFVDLELLEALSQEYDLIDEEEWYQLYQHRESKSFWRLDKPERLQTRYFVRVESRENWTTFQAMELEIELLLAHRGTSNEKCLWQNCQRDATERTSVL